MTKKDNLIIQGGQKVTLPNSLACHYLAEQNMQENEHVLDVES